MALFNGRSLGGQERRPGLLGRMRENRQQRRAGGSSAAMQPSPSFDQVAAVAKPVTPAPVIKPDVYRSGQGPDPATTPKTVSHVNRFGQGPDPANTPKVVLQGGPASPPPAGVTLPKSATNPLRGMSGQSMQGDAAAMKNAGMAALNRGDTGSALDSFQNAYRYRDQLSTKDQDMVQDKAQLLYNKQRSQELRDRANFKEMLEDPSIDPVNPPMGLFNPARGRNSNGPYEGYSIEPAVFDGSGVRAINTGLSSPSIPRRSESERLGVNPSNSSLATPFNQTGESFIPVSPQNPDLNSIVNGELQEGYTRSNQLLNEVNPPTWSQLMERSQDAYRDSFNNLPQGVLGDIAPFLSGQPAYPSLRSPGSQSVVDTVENSLFSAPGLVINPSVQPQPVAPAQPQASAPSQPQASAPAQPRPSAPSQPRPSAPSQPQQIAPDQPGYQAQFPAPADFALDRTFDQQRRKSIQDQMIKERMAALGGDPARSSLGVTQPAPPPNPDAFGYRTYTSDDGRFSRDAVVMGINNGKAVMQYGNGSVSEVPLDRLSPESREQAITSSALRDTARGYDANFNPVSPEQGFNRLFGGRDRNELFRSVTGEATAADPYTYRTEQVARDSQIFAPPENEPIDEELVRQLSARDRNRTAKALQPSGLPDIPDPNPGEPLLAPRGSAYYNPDDPRNRRPFVPLQDVDAGQQMTNRGDSSGIVVRSPVTRRTQVDSSGNQINTVMPSSLGIDTNGNVVSRLPSSQPGTQGRIALGAASSSAPSTQSASESTTAYQLDPNALAMGARRTYQLDSQGNPIPGSFSTPLTSAARREIARDPELSQLSPQEAREQLLARNAAAYEERKAKREQRAEDIKGLAGGMMNSYGQTGQITGGLQGGAMGAVSPINIPTYGRTGPSYTERTGAARQMLAAMDIKQRREDALRQEQQQREDALRLEEQRRQDALLAQQQQREDAVTARDAQQSEKDARLKSQLSIDELKAKTLAEAEAEKIRNEREREDVLTAQEAERGNPGAISKQRDEAGIGGNKTVQQEVYEWRQMNEFADIPEPNPGNNGDLVTAEKNRILNYLQAVYDDPELSKEAKKREFKKYGGTSSQMDSLIEDSGFDDKWGWGEDNTTMFRQYQEMIR